MRTLARRPAQKNPLEASSIALMIGAAVVAGIGVYAFTRPKASGWKRVAVVPQGARFRLSTTTDGGQDHAPDIDDSQWGPDPVYWHGADVMLPVDWPADDPYPRANATHVEGIASTTLAAFPPNSAVWTFA